MNVITRFAPSPSGVLHMGGARTAFYSWLFARKHHGKFILRIEDSDKKRYKPQYIYNLLKGLEWLKIDWDEGPIFQSKRYERYYFMMKHLLAKNLAYKCFCSTERLRLLRKFQLSMGKKPKYDKHCLFNKNKANNNNSYVVRFNTPIDGKISFEDKIRGVITFDNRELDDLIICRSDGNYTYNFCSVVDDFDMGITHIIRGEDHINNTPRQINIFKSFKIKNLPKYAHLSMLLDINKRKISKRDKAKDILYYKSEGYFSESILSYLLILNNNKEDRSIFKCKMLPKIFFFNKKNRSAIIFDEKKLRWCNKLYINNLQNILFINHFKDYILYFKNFNREKIDFIKLISLLKMRVTTLKEMYKNFLYFYKDINEYICLFLIKKLKLLHFSFLTKFYYKILSLKIWSKENIKKQIKILINKEKIGFKEKDIYLFLRIIFTENTVSPPIVDIIEILKKEIILKRIHNMLFFLNII